MLHRLLFRTTRTVLYMHISARPNTICRFSSNFVISPLRSQHNLQAFLSCLRFLLPVKYVPPQQAVSSSGDLEGQACGPKRVRGALLPLCVLPSTSVFFSLPSSVTVMIVAILKKKLRGLSPRANYTDRAAAAGRRS